MKSPNLWQQNGWLNYLLLPFSILFYAVIGLRRWLYQKQILTAYQSPIPVVIVGNICVGGAGKTPLLIALGELLNKKQIPFAVISRGYQGNYRKHTNYKVVEKTNDASVVGDEPLLIKHRLDCPLVVSPSRALAAKVISETYPQVAVILSDDGLQHYALQRDIEIAVTNKMAMGNGQLLPAGPLRETQSRLTHCQFVVDNDNTTNLYYYQLQPSHWQRLNSSENRPLNAFADVEMNTLFAFCGIAYPSRFFDTLKTLGIDCQTKSFIDHFDYQQSQLPMDKTLLMTEKDAIKLRHLTHPDAWVLMASAQLSEPLQHDFLTEIEKLL